MSTPSEQAPSSGLVLVPSPASPPEVLALKPNRYEDAVAGPHPQISSATYVHFTKPNGDEFIAPLANAATYEAKGYTRGADEVIDNIQAYLDEKAGRPHMEERKQTPEDAMARMAGVPRTEEEIAAEQEALEKERAANVAARSQPAQAEDPGPQPPDPEPEAAPRQHRASKETPSDG